MAEKKIPKFILDVQEMQAKKEAEMVQKIIEKVKMQLFEIKVKWIVNSVTPAQVKAECKAQGEDVDRRGYTKHYAATS